MEAELVKMLNHKITWERFSSRDGAGKATYLAPVELPCFLDGRVKAVRNSLGYEAISKFTIFLDGTSDVAQITVDDRITMPGGSRPTVLAVEQVYDEYGRLHHVEVYV